MPVYFPPDPATAQLTEIVWPWGGYVTLFAVMGVIHVYHIHLLLI